jgi:meso-butanediol dehydrogenase/(S,S)-butanediol dehydrogenase/diacetyl reductase
MRLQGKVAIIAGGGQGIGEGIVKCLAEEGADIAILDINPTTGKKIANQVKALGRKALSVVADATEEKEVNKAVKDIVDHFGKIDILVNNVGGVSEATAEQMAEYAASLGEIGNIVPYLRFGPDTWDKYYQLNLKSHVMLSHAVTPYFIEQRYGKIVNISSTSGRIADPSQMPYAAMKAADISITWTMARTLAPFNITVNCVCPGFVYTPLWDRGATNYLNQTREAVRMAKAQSGKLPARFERFDDVDLENMTPREYWLKFIVIPNTPNGREQTPEDMGRAVAFFVSDDAKNITGQVLHVDGGFVMR